MMDCTDYKDPSIVCIYPRRNCPVRVVQDEAEDENPTTRFHRNHNTSLQRIKLAFGLTPINAVEASRTEQIRKFNSDNLNDSRLSDIKVLAKNGEIFYASKSLLCAQSEVFRTRFSKNWDGTGEKNTITTDYDSSVVEPLVRFVQTGKPGDISTVSEKLFEAADYYGLENLELVVRLMTEPLSVITVLCYLELAFQHNNKLQPFKKYVLAYAVEHMNEVVALAEWKEFYDNHYEIVKELLIFER